MLHRRGKPVAEEVLAHGQAQATDHDQAQPPVIEGDRARHYVLVVTCPVNDEPENKRGKGNRLDDGDKRVVSEITHHRPIQAKTDE
ncbi:hypothetical protein D3C80_1381110 [compost metagenome]